MQTTDTSVNKPAKDHLKHQVDEWQSEQMLPQLERKDISGLEILELQPINFGLPGLKEFGVK